MIPKVRKAVFPAAGLGTRFLPATKAQPKEMLPVVDKPLIQYGVEEAIASGVPNIIIITGRNKSSIEDHFDVSFELERTPSHLEGEVVVSAERAVAVAGQYGWSAEEELLLYVIHGVLHLIGYDDTTPGKRAAMRRRERVCLGRIGVEARFQRCRPGHAASRPRTPCR